MHRYKLQVNYYQKQQAQDSFACTAEPLYDMDKCTTRNDTRYKTSRKIHEELFVVSVFEKAGLFIAARMAKNEWKGYVQTYMSEGHNCLLEFFDETIKRLKRDYGSLTAQKYYSCRD